VSKGAQKANFDRRQHDPLRQWKLSEVDMQAQEVVISGAREIEIMNKQRLRRGKFVG